MVGPAWLRCWSLSDGNVGSAGRADNLGEGRAAARATLVHRRVAPAAPLLAFRAKRRWQIAAGAAIGNPWP
jgi:hypothetical protein